jgi:hypothetical protein
VDGRIGKDDLGSVGALVHNALQVHNHDHFLRDPKLMKLKAKNVDTYLVGPVRKGHQQLDVLQRNFQFARL